MNVQINGKKENIVKPKVSITELLQLVDVKMPEMVSVQLNGTILKRAQFEKTLVEENDQIEFMYFMGGGGAVKEGRVYEL